MLALCVSIFLASIAGSTHCAGMCGAFLLVATTDTSTRPTPAPVLHGLYHAGRLLTYVTLGAIAGAAGGVVQETGTLLGVQRAALMLAGGAMVVFGMVTLLRQVGVRLPRLGVPVIAQRALLHGHRAISPWSPRARALGTGLLTTLLPCGWLYAFVIAAAGTAHPALGSLAMAAFWLGTVPILVALGTGLHALAGPLRARVPVLTSVLVVCTGLASVAGRGVLPIDLARPLEPRGTLLTTTKSPRTMVPICHGNPDAR